MKTAPSITPRSPLALFFISPACPLAQSPRFFRILTPRFLSRKKGALPIHPSIMLPFAQKFQIIHSRLHHPQPNRSPLNPLLTSPPILFFIISPSFSYITHPRLHNNPALPARISSSKTSFSFSHSSSSQSSQSQTKTAPSITPC
jgi:hypothetical protein